MTDRATGPRATGPRALAGRALGATGVGVVIVLALVAILTALRTELPRSPGVMSDALGPENGEQIDDYLTRAAESLVTGEDGADDDAPRWTLITAARAWTVPEAADVVRGLPRVSGLYLQVPVPGVAMPVTGVTVTEPTAGEFGRGPVFERGLEQAVRRLEMGAAAGTGPTTPPGADRAAETTALTVARMREGDPVIIGLLARGNPAQLRAVAAQPQVRAVEALPDDAVWERFAVRPLQPQQVDAADPLPDHAPVPPG